MSDWTGGYVADIGYTHGYYAELNPLRMRFALLKAGYAAPAMATACELGFGQGISVTTHAGASATAWHGTDFNPAQAGFARELAALSGANADLRDEAFEQFCSRQDLPDFDFIGLHGIWSWISDDNRRIITDFARRKLKVGGVLYVSYNTQPGWAAMAPVRDLMVEHAKLMGAPGSGIVSRVDEAIAFAQKVIGTDSAFARANPGVAGRLDDISKQNRNYVAHEYFNGDWLPMSFSKMKGWLEEAKLNFACSAHVLDHIDSINVTPEQRAMLNSVPDRMFRETVRDFLVNTQFRRDYWVKGLRPLAVAQRNELLRRERFVLATPKERITLKVAGLRGEGMLDQKVYEPIMAVMEDRQIRSLQEIERAIEGKGIEFATLVEAITILVGKGTLYPAQDEAAIAAAAPVTRALNRQLCEQARYSDAVSTLASPVTGGAVTVGRFEQLMLLARADGLATPEGWSRFILRTMNSQGQHVLQHGQRLETPEQELAVLVETAVAFRDGYLPVLDALRVEC